MLLSGRLIKGMLHAANVPVKEQLIVTPVLDWEEQIADGSGSIDVRLGQKFQVPKRTRIPCLDHLSDKHRQQIERYKEETFVPIGDHFVLHPKQFVLGETLEWVHLPYNLSAYLIGRSSWGRDGLIIATATGIHPGYSGIITLELSNIGEIPIFLYPGLTVAQLFIQEVKGTEIGDKDRSKLWGSTAPKSVNAATTDKRIIEAFKEPP